MSSARLRGHLMQHRLARLLENDDAAERVHDVDDERVPAPSRENVASGGAKARKRARVTGLQAQRAHGEVIIAARAMSTARRSSGWQERTDDMIRSLP